MRGWPSAASARKASTPRTIERMSGAGPPDAPAARPAGPTRRASGTAAHARAAARPRRRPASWGGTRSSRARASSSIESAVQIDQSTQIAANVPTRAQPGHRALAGRRGAPPERARATAAGFAQRVHDDEAGEDAPEDHVLPGDRRSCRAARTTGTRAAARSRRTRRASRARGRASRPVAAAGRTPGRRRPSS